MQRSHLKDLASLLLYSLHQDTQSIPAATSINNCCKALLENQGNNNKLEKVGALISTGWLFLYFLYYRHLVFSIKLGNLDATSTTTHILLDPPCLARAHTSDFSVAPFESRTSQTGMGFDCILSNLNQLRISLSNPVTEFHLVVCLLQN